MAVSDFGDFCAQAGPAYCAYAGRCQGATRDASLCLAQGGPSTIGCVPELLAKVDAGVLLFDADAGAACLGLLLGGRCNGADPHQVERGCSPYAYLAGNTPLGSPCSAYIDCAYVDAGPGHYTFGAGCRADTSSLACAGTCTLGSTLGEPCGDPWRDAWCGPGQGVCRNFATPDGGLYALCVPYAPDGGACSPDGFQEQCDPDTAYCADAGPAGYLCQPRVPDGGACDPLACGEYLEACACAVLDGFYCAEAASPGSGNCRPFAPGSPCIANLWNSCGKEGECYTVGSLPDGGSVGACAPRVPTATGAGPGEPCSLPFTPCAYPLVCSPAGVCAWPPALGDPCTYAQGECPYPLQCTSTDGGAPTCQDVADLGEPCLDRCDTYLYCAPGQPGVAPTCQAPLPPGSPCTLTVNAANNPCENGYCRASSPGSQAGTCVATVGPGEPCEPEFRACAGPEFGTWCTNEGSPDGGWFCKQPLCEVPPQRQGD